MDLICCSYVEWKLVNSCRSIDKIPTEKIVKFLIENDLTINADGRFYVCLTCKASIDRNTEPKKAQKEILGFLSFPSELTEMLKLNCTPKSQTERNDQNRNDLMLNRLEDYLLKPVITFIRIGHLPRGRYFQLKGELIMISANIEDTMKQILPVKQSFIPVSFKKKLEYSGHYIQEYIDRKKIKLYFEWYKKFNHLFAGYELDETLISNYEKEAMERVAEVDTEKSDELIVNHNTFTKETVVDMDDLDTDEEHEESVEEEKEFLKCEHSSLITSTKKIWMHLQLQTNLQT